MVTSITQYDQIIDPRHNAQTLVGLANNTFDFLHSSHCLEHVHDIWQTLANWLRVLKPGGYMIVTVPDWLRYEGMVWPSRYNSDHKHAFTTSSALHSQWWAQYGEISKSLHFTNPTKYTLKHVPTILDTFCYSSDIERIQLLSDKWVPSKIGEDQTLGEAECAIEFVLRKALPPGVHEQTMVETLSV